MLPAKPAVVRVAEDEYLRAERTAVERHVYLDGKVWSMAGESLPHGQVSVNLVILIGGQLRGRPCQVLSKDTKVRSGPAGPRPLRGASGLYSYPDIVVVCGEPEVLDEHEDVLLNPTAIIEVLSPSTEKFDRNEKFDRFERWNPTLTDYLLVSQDQARVEHYTRQPDGSWRCVRHVGPAAVCEIASVGVRLPLAEVYDRVTFPDADAEPTDG